MLAPRRRHTWAHGLPLKMRFQTSKLYVSAIPPFVIGAVVGVLAAIMGVGGGFIMVPAMIYLIGMPTKVVVGTSVFQFLFVTGFTAVLHAVQSGTVDVLLALILLVGGVIGAQIGVGLATRLRAEQLRVLLALLVHRRLPEALRRPGDPAGRALFARAVVRRVLRLLALLARARRAGGGAGVGGDRALGRRDRAQRRPSTARSCSCSARSAATAPVPDGRRAARHRHHAEGAAAQRDGAPQGAAVRHLGQHRRGRGPAGAELLRGGDDARRCEEILSETEQLRYGIGMAEAVRRVGGHAERRRAVHRGAGPAEGARTAATSQADGAVRVAEETLFQTRIEMPANLVEGDYAAEFFLVRDHEVINSGETLIRVEKTGIERWLYNLSVQRAAALRHRLGAAGAGGRLAGGDGLPARAAVSAAAPASDPQARRRSKRVRFERAEDFRDRPAFRRKPRATSSASATVDGALR